MYDAMKDKASVFGCVAILILCCFALSTTLSGSNDEHQFYYSHDQVESYTTGDFDQLKIWKIYRLSVTDDPAHISTSDFESNGWRYHMLEMDKSELDGQVIYTVIFNGTKIR